MSVRGQIVCIYSLLCSVRRPFTLSTYVYERSRIVGQHLKSTYSTPEDSCWRPEVPIRLSGFQCVEFLENLVVVLFQGL